MHSLLEDLTQGDGVVAALLADAEQVTVFGETVSPGTPCWATG